MKILLEKETATLVYGNKLYFVYYQLNGKTTHRFFHEYDVAKAFYDSIVH